MDVAPASDESILQTRLVLCFMQSIRIPLQIPKRNRIYRGQLLVQFIEASFVSHDRDPFVRLDGEVIAALGAHMEIALKLLFVDDLLTGIAF
jgi:hypothetical protein